MRKLNAWGWNMLVGKTLNVYARDLDCAFKLIHTKLLALLSLETQGAMINAELLYKLQFYGYTWREVGVHHLPRLGGKATGANLGVILRALRDLLVYARRWRLDASKAFVNSPAHFVRASKKE